MEEQVVPAKQQESNSEGYLFETVTPGRICMQRPNYSDGLKLRTNNILFVNFVLVILIAIRENNYFKPKWKRVAGNIAILLL